MHTIICVCNYTLATAHNYVETPTIRAVSNVTIVTGGIAEQDVAILQCDRPVEGCPPGSIRWKHKGDVLNNASHFTIITTVNYSKLIISDVSAEDSGVYECEVMDNYNNQIAHTEQINLTVSSKLNAITAVFLHIYIYRCHYKSN